MDRAEYIKQAAAMTDSGRIKKVLELIDQIDILVKETFEDSQVTWDLVSLRDSVYEEADDNDIDIVN
jgi:hypothetical protein